MIWKIVRLELASTETFPRGSAVRAFLLHVPIASDGRIDRAAINQYPGRATVRRYWGSEPDTFGLIEPMDERWALHCARRAGEKATFLLDAVPLELDGEVIVQQPGGLQLPFRVASMHCNGQRP